MKSYIQGMITGGVMVFATIVFLGASGKNGDIGKFQIVNNFEYWVLNDKLKMQKDVQSIILDTENGDAYYLNSYMLNGEVFSSWTDLNTTSMEESMKKRKLKDLEKYKK